MKRRIIFTIILIILIFISFNILSSQKQSYAGYLRRVQNYIKYEGKEYNFNEDLKGQEAFEMMLEDVGDNIIYMFGDYYRTKEINLLATKVFILLHKYKGFDHMLIDIDAQYQDDYDKWLETGEKDYYFLPYFTKEAEKILFDYYNSLPEQKKFRILCMKEAAQDEGETFTSRDEYLGLGGDDDGYREVVRDNRYKTFVRKLLEKNPYQKYYIYIKFTNTTKFSDMSFFKAEYERLGTYLHERNPISKGRVFSTVCGVRSGRTVIGNYIVSVVPNNSFNNLPYNIEQAMGIDTEFFVLPLTKGFAKGAIFDQVREGGWQIDSLAPAGDMPLVEVKYNKINKRWNYMFYFSLVSQWERSRGE